MSTPARPTIQIIRHAEKPTDDPQTLGVDSSGNENPECLIPLGWQRAGALATLFDPSHGTIAPGLATPRTIFAAGVGKHSNSHRPKETVKPLADKLGLKIDESFLKGDETAMVEAALAKTGVVLISWQHQDIPGIANQILGNTTTVPQSWPGDRFDIVWVFTPDGSGAYTFTQVPQLLLHGDSPDVISG
jgi:hypothetical protein